MIRGIGGFDRRKFIAGGAAVLAAAKEQIARSKGKML